MLKDIFQKTAGNKEGLKHHPFFVLSLIFLLALFLRLVNLDTFFPSSDSISLAYEVSYNYPDSFDNLWQVFANSLGLGASLVGTVLLFLAKVFSFNITEFVWHLPFILIGGLTVFPVYYLMRFLRSPRAGLFAAFLLAIFPWHIQLSRSSGYGFVIISFFIDIWVILVFTKLFQKPSKKNLLIGSIALTLDILFSIFSPFVLIALVIIGVFMFYKVKIVQAIKDFIKIIINKRFLVLPILALFLQTLITASGSGKFVRGVGGQNSFQGLDIVVFFKNGMYFAGAFVFLLLLVFFFSSFIFLKPKNKISVIIIWVSVFATSFLFLFNRYPTRYFTLLIGLFLVISAFWLDLLMSKKRFFKLGPFLGVVLFLFISFNFILFDIGALYKINSLLAFQKHTSRNFCRRDCLEMVNKNTGLKAAAYWIREKTKGNARIFGYALNGNGLEPNVVEYYFRRPYIAMFDARKGEMNSLLQKYLPAIDYVLIEKSELIHAQSVINKNFKVRAIVLDSEEELFFILSKEENLALEKVMLREGAEKFDRAYSNFSSVVDYEVYKEK